METLLALELVRATESAAIESARFMGRGDRMEADRAAVEAMRKTFDEVEMDGTIVIGEGERDEAPMLFIGERVGMAEPGQPQIDIAVDPLEAPISSPWALPTRSPSSPRPSAEGCCTRRTRTWTSCASGQSRPGMSTFDCPFPKTCSAWRMRSA